MLYLAGTQTRLKVGDPTLINRRKPPDPENPPDPKTPHCRPCPTASFRSLQMPRPTALWWASNGGSRSAIRCLRSPALLAERQDRRRGPAGTQTPAGHCYGHTAFASSVQELGDLVRRRQKELTSRPAAFLKPWLARVAGALDDLRAATVAPALDRTVASPLEDRISRLIAPPSKPRANALQVPRSLTTSFESTGDAGLKLLGAVAPALKTTLGPALAGYQAASPEQPIKVWALRLQAGLFGRAFPRRAEDHVWPRF